MKESYEQLLDKFVFYGHLPIYVCKELVLEIAYVCICVHVCAGTCVGVSACVFVLLCVCICLYVPVCEYLLPRLTWQNAEPDVQQIYRRYVHDQVNPTIPTFITHQLLRKSQTFMCA